MPVTSFLAPAVFFLSSEPSGGGGTVVTSDQMMDIIDAITGQVSVTNILGVLVAAVGAAIGFVFLWWGVRKLLSTFFSGFRKGKASV